MADELRENKHIPGVGVPEKGNWNIEAVFGESEVRTEIPEGLQLPNWEANKQAHLLL